MSAAGAPATHAVMLALMALALLSWPRRSRAVPRLADLERRGRLRSSVPSGPRMPIAHDVTRWLRRRIPGRGQAQTEHADVLRSVRLLAEELRGGADPAHAWAGAAAAGGQASPWLGRVARRAALGGTVGAALMAESTSDQWAEPDRVLLARLAAAWSCGEHSGASAADVLQHWADDAEARGRAAADIDSQLAGPRASAWLLAGLPLLGLAMGAAMGADPLGTLLGTAAGLGLLAVGLALEGIGVLWVRRIVRAAARA